MSEATEAGPEAAKMTDQEPMTDAEREAFLAPLYESVLYGWNLERKGDVVRAVCTFCRYSFARGVGDTLREFAETAAQHECRWGL